MAHITYSPEERAARLESARAELTSAVEAIASGDQWQAFLRFAGRLHQYSASNRFWLFQQAMMRGWSELGQVAGYRTWLTFGRHVRKGERGLKVLAPCRYKLIEEKTGEEIWAVRGFTVDTVFAARQTEGEELPEPVRPELLKGEGPEGAWATISRQVEAQGFEVKRAPLFPANGETSFLTKVVTVAEQLDDAAAVKTVVHELAHIILHQPEQVNYHADRERCEAEAESVAYLVCSELGLATDAYTFPYVATWAKGDMRVVTEAAEKALSCAKVILGAIEGHHEAVAA